MLTAATVLHDSGKCCKWEDSTDIEVQPHLIGAVTTGVLWQFGVLHRETKLIEQTLNSYRVTEDLEQLMRILIAALLDKAPIL